MPYAAKLPATEDGARPTTCKNQAVAKSQNLSAGSSQQDAWLERIELLTDDFEWESEEGNLFSELAANPSTPRSAVFAAKNASLRLSLAASLLWSAELYAQQVDLLKRLASGLSPGTILDIGCEQGLLTCLIAELWSNAQVTGFDRSPEAIACAGQLAEELGIKNLTLDTGDVFAPTPVSLKPAELVFTSRSILGEAIEIDQPDINSNWTTQAAPAAERLASLTSSEGLLVSLERGTAITASLWSESLEAAGFAVLGERCQLITTGDATVGYEQFFVIFARRSGTMVSR